MDFPWIPLFFNFLLLGTVLFVCRTINASNGNVSLNGALIYFVFCLLATVLDLTLTMVFASASFHSQTHYESAGSRTAWAERVFGYLVPCVVSLALAITFRRRQRFAGARARAGKVPRGAVSSATAS